jgi:hypothetical protein
MKPLLLIFILGCIQMMNAQNIVLNEVMSSNVNTIYDEDGDAPDWLELYNGDANQLSLEGYYLSDDTLNIKKWRFGNAVIDPEKYLIVFASDKDTSMIYWHTNFKLSATSGERLILSDSTGSIIDQIDIPASLSDYSYARMNDGSLTWLFQVPSPGSANTGEEIPGFADSVSVSNPGGFYSSAISVALSANDSRIFYTLDGSEPDSNSTEYSAPINISKTTVLRAISLKQNHFPSPEIYQSYFINENTDLPVISLIADPYNLFDADSGIYTNYTLDWERPAHVEFFEDDKSPGFSENCGIEIFGSQSATWDQKSISVKFKNKYGTSKIEYPLFPGFDLTTFKAFVLRNSGNDWQYTHIRDAVMQDLVKDLDIDYLEYRPATTFINGEYWGIYNIREKVNEHYIANRHGVDSDNIDMLENNMEVIHGDSLGYQQLIDYMSTSDMTTEAAYAYLDSAIDLDECILYFAAQAYYDNMDWPGTNIKFWRERSDAGKWRWILFGLDFGFGLYGHGEWEDHIEFMFSEVETRYSNPPWATLFQRKLIENPTIRNRFINQVADLLNTNFKSARVVSAINTLANHISGEITRHRTRWGLFGENLDKMIAFAQNRPDYLRTHLYDYFNCGDDASVRVNVSEGGWVQLNTLRLSSADMPFVGIYFQDNEVHLKAIPASGYKFDSWSGDISSTEASVTLSGIRSVYLDASFSIDTSPVKEIVINEINYNSADDFESGDWIELYNNSDQAVNISGWVFSDSVDIHQFKFPDGTVIDPDNYLVVIDNDSAFTSRFPNVENYVGETGFGLSGSGELITLADENGRMVDSLIYDDNLPWPMEADGLGASLELLDAESDNSLAESWKSSSGHGTPGTINSVLTTVDGRNDNITPDEFSLFQNYPNPFNPTTTIKYSVPEKSHLSLKIYDLLGKEVATIFEGERSTGNYTVVFDGSRLSSGIYLYQLKSEKVVRTKKFLILK